MPPSEDDGWTAPFTRPVQGTILDEDVWQSHSGLDVLRGIASDALPKPPSHYLFGLRPTIAEEGVCEFTMPASGWLASPLGFVEGGVTAFLADCTLGGAVQTTVPAGTAIAPTDLRVQFLRPIPTDGTLVTAHAAVVHRGRSFAAARAELTNEHGKLVALAGAGVVILPGRRADLRGGPPLG